MPVNSLALE